MLAVSFQITSLKATAAFEKITVRMSCLHACTQQLGVLLALSSSPTTNVACMRVFVRT
jgi:hypothetical protein